MIERVLAPPAPRSHHRAELAADWLHLSRDTGKALPLTRVSTAFIASVAKTVPFIAVLTGDLWAGLSGPRRPVGIGEAPAAIIGTGIARRKTCGRNHALFSGAWSGYQRQCSQPRTRTRFLENEGEAVV